MHDNLNLEYLNGLIHQGSTHLSAISLHLSNSTPQSPSHNYHSQVFNDDNSFFLDYTNHNSHVYVYNYSYLNNNYHLKYCKCGLNQQELHAYRIDLRYDEEYCMCGVENPYYNDFGILSKREKEEEYEK